MQRELSFVARTSFIRRKSRRYSLRLSTGYGCNNSDTTETAPTTGELGEKHAEFKSQRVSAWGGNSLCATTQTHGDRSAPARLRRPPQSPNLTRGLGETNERQQPRRPSPAPFCRDKNPLTHTTEISQEFRGIPSTARVGHSDTRVRRVPQTDCTDRVQSSCGVTFVFVKIRSTVFKVSKICDNNYKSISSSINMYNDSVIAMKTETFSGVAAKSPIGQCIKSVLRRACLEKRLTIGLLPAIQYLSTNCNGALFCFTAEAPPGDSATHMQEVLLQAFCVENGIYVIKVDSPEKIRRVLGCTNASTDFSCVLVHYPYTDPFTDSQEIDFSILSDAEKDLVDHCEDNWGYTQTPVIKLPEK
ncbi:Growth arrest and DNA damage-inducible protein GADD45 alpha [Eumeta japonica]|uniref:Growth arrest and DNA damage-inducible protein GADD45 alpha n=1 Tax=Eumeta variegata TaxID=151549 RepID=A0A4C1YGP3_EUMVA|nr:Growth arrest and DNA damage-inducible protein GADD45 alpha [Eumeta japonica]